MPKHKKFDKYLTHQIDQQEQMMDYHDAQGNHIGIGVAEIRKGVLEQAQELFRATFSDELQQEEDEDE